MAGTMPAIGPIATTSFAGAARILGVSRAAVDGLVDRGELGTYAVAGCRPRIPLDQVLALRERSHRHAPAPSRAPR